MPRPSSKIPLTGCWVWTSTTTCCWTPAPAAPSTAKPLLRTWNGRTWCIFPSTQRTFWSLSASMGAGSSRGVFSPTPAASSRRSAPLWRTCLRTPPMSLWRAILWRAKSRAALPPAIPAFLWVPLTFWCRGTPLPRLWPLWSLWPARWALAGW